jgi:hypothetical protein
MKGRAFDQEPAAALFLRVESSFKSGGPDRQSLNFTGQFPQPTSDKFDRPSLAFWAPAFMIAAVRRLPSRVDAESDVT